MLGIYPFPTLIKFKEIIHGVQHCVTVVGKWIFDINILFACPLTHDDMDYFCTNDDEIKGLND